MLASILNKATTKQMGYTIFHFSSISNLQIRIYFAVIYPCAVNNSAQSTAPPAAPRTVL